ncbi:MAG: dephospho-CoA kinase [Bifidobacteriaceae bacterium]|jgi:dephospho-CoA kinase|nr:dephospho-CoA kinase [Bifidobacteriaceae bacterium]MCI1915231.1 dephospho-CoA kinase [Bifidobacteriaceae bacterium]
MLTRVALTGGIGAGKSTVARHLESLGAYVIDYDVLSRQAVAHGTVGLRRVVDLFGPEALTTMGEMNRGWISQRIFADPQMRDGLDDIIHPLVFAEAARLETEWLTAHTEREKPPVGGVQGRRVVVHDIPLLVESGRADWFDVIIDVEAPARVRMHRLMAERGMSMEEASSRIDSQASQREREQVATYVIDSNQPLEQTFEQVDTVFQKIVKG